MTATATTMARMAYVFILAIMLHFMSNTSVSAQAVVGGPAAAVPRTTDMEYFSSMNRLPASNSVQRLNPPVFQWMYYEDPALLNNTTTYEYNETRVFNLQLTTNGSFTSPLWNYTVSNNFYNFFPPITNADGSTFTGDVSWRIRYMNSNNTVLMGTSPAHTFRMAADAEIWDRSCFADKTYLNTFSNIHPRFFVKETNKTAFQAFIHGPNLSSVIPNVSLASYTNSIAILSDARWTTDANTLTNIWPAWVFLAGAIADMGIAYHGVTNEWFTNAINAASPSVASVLTNWVAANETAGYDRLEAYAGNFYGLFGLAVSYDSFYHLLNDSQRAFIRRHMLNWASFYIVENWYYTGSTPNTDRVYWGRPLQIKYPSIAKQGESHMRHDRGAMSLVLALIGDEPEAAHLLEYYLSYYIARFDPYGYSGEDPRTYGAISTILDWGRSFEPWVLANLMFYDKKLTNAPVYNELADVVMFHTPTGFRTKDYTWGQARCYCESYFNYNQNPWQYAAFATFAAMQGRGDYYQQHLRSAHASLGGNVIAEALTHQAIVTPFYYPAPTPVDRATNSFIDPVRGWAVGLSSYPNSWDTYSNAVGWVFQARPTGTGRNSGGQFSDGSIEMWAYGASVTAGGSGYFLQAALLHNGVFVDGIGANNANPAIAFPVHARLEAYTNYGDGVYTRADLTHVLNISNYVGGGAGNLQSVANSAAVHNYMQSSNARPDLIRVTRSILSPHNLYQVIRDTGSSTNPHHWQFKWNAWPTNTTFDPSTMTLAYRETNNFTGRSNISVVVKKLRDNTVLDYVFQQNTNNPQGMDEECVALQNPFTGENYAGTNNWQVGDTDMWRYWSTVLWTFPRTKTTNWTDTTVVAVSKGDTNTFRIVAIDADRVAVTNESLGIADFISYNTNDVPGGAGTYAGIANIVIDEGEVVTVSVNTNPPSDIAFTSATPGNGQVSLQWTESTLQYGYHLLYYPSGGPTNAVSYGSGAASATVSGLNNGTQYFFDLQATNAYGSSATASTNATPAAGGGGEPVGQTRSARANSARVIRVQGP